MHELKIVTFGQARITLNGRDVVWHAASARELFFSMVAKSTC
jgi:two-component SAPR family response regulator